MSHLLHTKLVPPIPRTPLVAREALYARLDQGVGRKLTLLSAPAGYGKTTLVASWLRDFGFRISDFGLVGSEQHTIQNPQVAWLSLDARDNDPARFWRYLVTACQTYGTAVGERSLSILATEQPTPFESVITLLLNDLATLSQRAVIVLEDYHLITTPQIHEGLAFFLDHVPAPLHLIIITRSDPPLPLARLRVSGDLIELRAPDLRFSAAEAQTFLDQALGCKLASADIHDLERRTEGWPAGLRLAALALGGRNDSGERSDFFAAFGGSHRHIVEYLVADVLAAQPDPLQQFLLLTSSLPQLSASLCDAVTNRSDSAATLDELERANLFVTPLDDTRQWYRYHALFAEAMQHEARQRLSVAQLQDVSRRSSEWYALHGLRAEAIEAALAAQLWPRAADLLGQIIEASEVPPELFTMRRWLEQLPQAILHMHPALSFTYAMALLFMEDRRAPATLARIQSPLQAAEAQWRAADDQPKLGTALAFRSLLAWWSGDSALAFATARRALELLPEDDRLWRGTCLMHLAMEALYIGKLDEAEQVLVEARERSAAADNRYAVRAVMSVLGEVCVQRGALHQADQIFAQIITDAHDDPLDRGYALVARAALAYEWNDLATAERSVDAALALGNQYADTLGRYYVEDTITRPGLLMQARLAQISGQTERANEILHNLLAQGHWIERDRLYREIRLYQAWFALASGNLHAVQSWATTVAQRPDEIPLIQQEREALLVARLLLAQGSPQATLRALDRWLAEARSGGRTRSELEIMLLMALAQRMNGDHAQAQGTILAVLGRAQTEQYQRLLLDEGAALIPLVQSALPTLPASTRRYAERLLHALNSQRTEATAPIEPPTKLATVAVPDFIEPLSPHEQRVLRLLAAGQSNPEIAEELVVSVNTIKTQVQSIFRKLDVSSRKQASALARKLGLV